MIALSPELLRDGFALRPLTEADRPFLRALFATTRADAAILALWPEDERNAFLDSQFMFQDVHYRRFYGDAQFLMIERHAAPAGRLILQCGEPQWYIIDIGLMPRWRGQGFGQAFIASIQAAAIKAGAASIGLMVESTNPAQRLYARRGFAPTDESGPYREMIWHAAAQPAVS